MISIHACPPPADWNSVSGNCLDSGGPAGPWSRWSYRFGAARLYLRCEGPTGPARLFHQPTALPGPASGPMKMPPRLRRVSVEPARLFSLSRYSGGGPGWGSAPIGSTAWTPTLPARGQPPIPLAPPGVPGEGKARQPPNKPAREFAPSSTGHPAPLDDPDCPLQEWANPLDALVWMTSLCSQAPVDGPPFKGGWVGYLSYELGRLFEHLPSRKASDSRPLFEFVFCNEVAVRGSSHPDQFLSIRCENPGAHPLLFAGPAVADPLPLRSNFTREDYEAAVARAIEYIRAGDVFQVNLSQRFTTGLAQDPREIYRRLRQQSPAWFGAFLQFPNRALICNSPELFLRVTPERDSKARRVITRPIKGTRPRGPGMDMALRDSAKDQAELHMIVDLERNDLGRVCRIGSVKVTEPRIIEAHPTVYHGAATIEGILRDDVSFVDLLRATFPGGSITGAPKIRAMQIIDELEPGCRGPYCGAIGYLSVDGHMEFNVAIRTMIVEDATIHIPVGGGIVADSVPADEYEETLLKAKALFAALGVATISGNAPISHSHEQKPDS
ncbi:MAG TPA: chorismate-binding protein [Tepidisphaeraceae bacterium]|nr:chorismate-binding protein [Tepidisphaeraceae bacterium]